MNIIGIHAQDHFGVGGALRGYEMGEALQRLGHTILPVPPQAHLWDDLGNGMKADAVILAGTWHQLTTNDAACVKTAHACDRRKIPCIWWYGSNGSVFGCIHPDPAVRKKDEERIISVIAERPFIGVICPYSMGIYERHGLPREKMRLIRSVFDADLFCPSETSYDFRVTERLKHKYGVPPYAFCIGTVGHTPNSKGGNEIIQAVALLKDEMPDLVYVILHTPRQMLSKVKARSPDGKKIGKSEWDVLRDSQMLAQKLGVADRVKFIGTRFPREAMPMFYRMLNVYCSPSKAENLGQPLVESQLCGLPLVTFKGFSFDFVSCPDTAQQVEPHHTVTDDYGLVIPEADPATLADAIRNARHMLATDRWTAEKTRGWARHRFHHHRAQAMLNAIEEMRGML